MTKKRKREKTSAQLVPHQKAGLSPEDIKRLCTTRLLQAPIKAWQTERNRPRLQEGNRSFPQNAPLTTTATAENDRPPRATGAVQRSATSRDAAKTHIIEHTNGAVSINSTNKQSESPVSDVDIAKTGRRDASTYGHGLRNVPAQRVNSIPATSSHWSSSDTRQSLNAFLQQNDGSDSESSDDESTGASHEDVPCTRNLKGSTSESFAEELRRATKDLESVPRLPSKSPTDSNDAGDRAHPQPTSAEPEETFTVSKLGSPALSESEGVSLPQALRSDRRKSIYSHDQDQTTSVIKSLALSKTDPEITGRHSVTKLAIRSSNQVQRSSKEHQQEPATAAPIPAGRRRIPRQPNNAADIATTTTATANMLTRLATPPNHPAASPQVVAAVGASSSQDDVYTIVNQIARDVLGSPRSFPPGSKQLNSSDSFPGSRGTEHHGISDIAVDALGDVRLRGQNGAAPVDLCDRSSGDALYAAFRRARSDSPLSELSRSPTPPPLVSVDQGPSGRKQHNGISVLGESDAAASPSALPLLLKKKCKMTGITSRHFSPVKAKKPRQAKARPQAVPPDDTTQEVGEKPQTLAPVVNSAAPLVALDTPILPQATNYEVDDGKTVDDRLLAIELQSPPKAPKKRSPAKRTKSTGKYSAHFPHPNGLDLDLLDRVDLYNTTASSRKVPQGTSICPVPSIHEPHFGIVQEKLWREPFWLLVAVVFLNQTTGRAAVPTFWNLKRKWPTIEALATADQQEVMAFIQHLGLQNQRSKRIIELAQVWLRDPPVAARRHRTLHYPAKGDGASYKPGQVLGDREDIEEGDLTAAAATGPLDTTLSPGALEIGHLPGCKQYAYDSWRIFCRDVLRGVADDYNGSNAVGKDTAAETTTTVDSPPPPPPPPPAPPFEPEWQRVLPQDKELRACVRWMWLREGWIWDPLTGSKRRATEAEMELAVKGEMEIGDPAERKFAAAAAEVAGTVDGSIEAEQVIG